MATNHKPKVLIASYLEADLVDEIRCKVPNVEILYEPKLLGVPRYPCDHTSMPTRTAEEESRWKELLSQAEIMFDFDYTHEHDLLHLAPNLKWIQATSAGIGQFVKKMKYDTQTNWIFTTASGIHAKPLAEFVMMSILMFTKDALHLEREKASHHWQRFATSELEGKTLAIIGLGKVGREIARCAKAFGMNVVGNRRTRKNAGSEVIQFIDELFGPDDLQKLLSKADFLCISVPHTPETEGLIGKKELSLLPKGAVLINIGRGVIVDQNALIEALRSGHLRGAALDVFATEPLPPDNPLWDLPNVIICPHSASTSTEENKKLVSLFCENLIRYLNEEPLLNKLDPVKMY